jgi:hypothetical protein
VQHRCASPWIARATGTQRSTPHAGSYRRCEKRKSLCMHNGAGAEAIDRRLRLTSQKRRERDAAATAATAAAVDGPLTPPKSQHSARTHRRTRWPRSSRACS